MIVRSATTLFAITVVLNSAGSAPRPIVESHLSAARSIGLIHSQDPPADPDVAISADSSRRIAKSRLRKEGKAFRKSGTLENLKPDFKTRYEFPLANKDVVRFILSRLDATDELVDGYMRWQLLSFSPTIDEIEIDELRSFVETLPGIPVQPTASPLLHTKLENIARLTGGNHIALKQLQSRWEKLRIQVRQHDNLTLPSIRFRDEMYEVLPYSGPARPIFLLYDLRDRIKAGVSTRSIKTKITKELKARRLDDTISAEIRWELIKLIEAMEEDKKTGSTKIISDITFYAQENADIHFSTMTVRPSDREKWTAYLNRHDPN